MTSDHNVMQSHVEALFTQNGEGDLVRVNEHNGARAPRFFLGRTVHAALLRFRDDVDTDLRRELRTASEDDIARNDGLHSPISASRYQDILARFAPVEKTWTGPAFCFPRHLPAW